MKKVITAFVLVLLILGIYFGVSNSMTYRAEADEGIMYTVHVMKNTDSGYIPKLDFEISKLTLEAYVKMCWWKSEWLNSGDLMISFDADDETWVVKLVGNDPEIKTIQGIVKEYGLKCSIPAR